MPDSADLPDLADLADLADLTEPPDRLACPTWPTWPTRIQVRAQSRNRDLNQGRLDPRARKIPLIETVTVWGGPAPSPRFFKLQDGMKAADMQKWRVAV